MYIYDASCQSVSRRTNICTRVNTDMTGQDGMVRCCRSVYLWCNDLCSLVDG